MKNVGTGQKIRDKREANYELAMKEAFSEVFRNLKEIERETKMQRKKIDLERRRGSAPATTLRETTAAFKRPKEELTRKLSTPIPPKSSLSKELTQKCFSPLPPKSSMSTMQWILESFEEENM